jgi:hypothetical protein
MNVFPRPMSPAAAMLRRSPGRDEEMHLDRDGEVLDMRLYAFDDCAGGNAGEPWRVEGITRETG